MRTMMAVAMLVLAGCAAPTVNSISASEPVLSTELKSEPRAAAKCVLGAVEDLGWVASMRDFGSSIQIVWTIGNGIGTRPIAIFDLQPAPGGTHVEMRTQGTSDPEKIRRTWQEKIGRC